MVKEHDKKTNAIRMLDAKKVNYSTHYFECPFALSGKEVARLLEVEQDRVFKTLVTQGQSGEHYVFMIPVAYELDLKKAAVAVNEKAVALVKSKDLFSLTGYIHGGCSPFGMKKYFTTTIDETAMLYEYILFSGGRLGCQIEMNPLDFNMIHPVSQADLLTY